MQDVERFQHNLLKACVAFDRKLDGMLSDVWWQTCASLSDDQFERAMDELLMEALRFPAPAQLRAMAYRMQEDRVSKRQAEPAPPGSPLLAAGDLTNVAVVLAKREGAKYAANPVAIPLFECLRCRDRHHVRIDTMVGAPHFGASIPCPHCRSEAYDRYVEKNGVPPGMPKWAAGERFATGGD